MRNFNYLHSKRKNKFILYCVRCAKKRIRERKVEFVQIFSSCVYFFSFIIFFLKNCKLMVKINNFKDRLEIMKDLIYIMNFICA